MEEIKNSITEDTEETLNEECYTHAFKKPFEYQGDIYYELTFDFDKMTGADSLAIENELRRKGHAIAVKALDPEYKIRFAARACVQKIGHDAFEYMRIKDYAAIMQKVQTFLIALG